VLARRLWSAVAEGDADSVRSLLASGVTWRSFGRNALSGEYHGPDGVLDYLARVGESSDDLVSTLDGIFAGDQGAVITYHVEARRGGKRLDIDVVLVLRIAGGKIVRGTVVPMDQYQNDRFWA
jgi:hypothetical protein